MKGFKKMGELLSDQYSSGSRLGFARGGTVKQSPQFKQKTEKQNDMDHANTQRGKDVASNKRDQEAGNQGPLRPGFKKGGKSKKKMKKAEGGCVEIEIEVGSEEEEEEKEEKKKGGRLKKKAGGKVKKKAGGKAKHQAKGHMKRSIKHQSAYEDKPHAHKKGGST